MAIRREELGDGIPWRAAHRGAWDDFRSAWGAIVVVDLVARGTVVALLTPLVALLLKLFLVTTGTGVVTDFGIVTFLLHPIGLLMLIALAAIGLVVLFIESGALLVIGFGVTEGRRVGWFEAFRHVARHAVELFHLARRVVVRLLIVAAPFLAAIGLLYFLLLRQFDINFYLASRPPEFELALGIAALLVLVLAAIVTTKIARWSLALSMVLFEEKTAAQAMQASRSVTLPYRWAIASWIVGWLATAMVVGGVATWVAGALGNVLVPDRGAGATAVILGLGGALLFAGLVNLSVSVLATVMFPLVLNRVFRSFDRRARLEPLDGAPVDFYRGSGVGRSGRLAVSSLVVVLAAEMVGGYFAGEHMDAEDTAQVIAHRGAAGAAPENTMAAFELAIAEGADWIELDVQENADGTVIVAHDQDYMRMSRDPRKVWQVTDEDLRTIDIGSWFSPEFASQRTPTLRQALELARGRVGVFIELKYYGHDEQLESRVAEIVEAVGMERHVVIMSLKLDGLLKMRSLRPDWTLGLLNTASVGDLTRLDVDFLALNGKASTPPTIRRARRANKKVYSWTINDPVQVSVMLSRGVAGVITDDPGMARQVLEIREELTAAGRFVVWLAGETGMLGKFGEPSGADDA